VSPPTEPLVPLSSVRASSSAARPASASTRPTAGPTNRPVPSAGGRPRPPARPPVRAAAGSDRPRLPCPAPPARHDPSGPRIHHNADAPGRGVTSSSMFQVPLAARPDVAPRLAERSPLHHAAPSALASTPATCHGRCGPRAGTAHCGGDTGSDPGQQASTKLLTPAHRATILPEVRLVQQDARPASIDSVSA
jgi:hypothetical protein